MRVIARKGMAEATIQEIATEAGVAKGTVYLYFRDRDDLVQKTCEYAIAELSQRLDVVVETDLPFEQKIRAMMAAKLAFFAEHRDLLRVYLTLRMPEGSGVRQHRQRPRHHPLYSARARRFAAYLEEAMNGGEIRRMNPYRLALFIMEGSTAIVLERVTEDASPPEDADVDLMTSIIVEGVRTRNGN